MLKLAGITFRALSSSLASPGLLLGEGMREAGWSAVCPVDQMLDAIRFPRFVVWNRCGFAGDRFSYSKCVNSFAKLPLKLIDPG